MEHYPQLDELLRRAPTTHSTIPAILAYAIGAVFFLHQVLVYLDIAVLSPIEITWNALVYLTPSIFLLNADRRRELRTQGSSWSQVHAAKSESLRGMLGLGSRALMQQLPAGSDIVRSIASANSKPKSDAPPGLGNWDNSCYQNSVLQGLSAVESLEPYLSAFSSHKTLPTNSTSSSLQEIVQKLNNISLNGTHIWTPAKLKSMSSWQQQDAQEYYSKIVDDLEKEASKVFGAAAVKPGLENAEKKKKDISEQMAAPPFSVPLEGLLAQRVACTRCGFSEGLSMIPFNCLTVPLGSDYEYDLADCLNDYTHIEDIPEVECAKCTLLRAKVEMSKMMPTLDSESDAASAHATKTPKMSPAMQEVIAKRLQAVNEALAADDFSDKTLKEVCQISKKAHVSSTKTRQAVIGRAPRGLVIHVNRSVFDEMTGAQKKNHAAVRYPQVLDLGKWMLGSKLSAACSNDAKSLADIAITEASESMLSNRSERDQCLYRLKAVITHYGRHENGHYIAYRQHPPASQASDDKVEGDDVSDVEDSKATEDGKRPWWRLSDEDVSSVADEDVLQQGGVFMLFYERDEQQAQAPSALPLDKPTEVEAPTAVASESSADQPSEVEHQRIIDPVASELNTDQPLKVENQSTAEPASGSILPTDSEDDAALVAGSGPSTSTATEDEESETDADDQPVGSAPIPKATLHPLMRTATTQSDTGFPSPHRVAAAI